MLKAKDFREKARASLKGKWGLAVGTGFVASLLGAGTAFLQDNSGTSGGMSFSAETLEELEMLFEEIPEEILITYVVVFGVMFVAMLLWALVLFIIGGPITLGYVKFNLNLVDGKEAEIKDLFSQFKRFGEAFLVQFLRNLFVVLWIVLFMLPGSLLGIGLAVVMSVGNVEFTDARIALVVIIVIAAMVPGLVIGVMKEYGYAMAPYILYENPGMSAYQSIQESRKLMKGNKWRFFCLGISFIGWGMLSLFTCGLGSLWLKPYQEAAFAAFYRGITAEKYGCPQPALEEERNLYNPYEEGSIL